MDRLRCRAEAVDNLDSLACSKQGPVRNRYRSCLQEHRPSIPAGHLHLEEEATLHLDSTLPEPSQLLQRYPVEPLDLQDLAALSCPKHQNPTLYALPGSLCLHHPPLPSAYSPLHTHRRAMSVPRHRSIRLAQPYTLITLRPYNSRLFQQQQDQARHYSLLYSGMLRRQWHRPRRRLWAARSTQKPDCEQLRVL
jgi:hypothetical protein